MALDRWLALVILAGCLAYGYTAWFLMDGSLPPFMQRNPVWPSTFPKVLAIVGAGVALVVALQPSSTTVGDEDIDYRRLHTYHLGRALALVGLMIAYALTLRPLGFIASTIGFLTLGAVVLGERRWLVLLPVATVATVAVWWLVEGVLGIYLRAGPALLDRG